MTVTTFNVEQSCGGCSNACKRILSKLDGVSLVEASLDDQTVSVTHEDTVQSDAMLKALMKWAENSGKAVSLKA